MKAGNATAQTATTSRKNASVRTRTRLALQDTFDTVKVLPGAAKIARGEVGEITVEELEEVFSHLAHDDSNRVPWKSVAMLLEDLIECSVIEVDALRQHVNVQPDGVVSAVQLHRAFAVRSIRSLMMDVYRDKIRRSVVGEVPDMHVERDLLVDRVVWRVNRDDAFSTLPMTILYMVIFCILVVYHLQIWRRQELERGLEAWIGNQGDNLFGPYIAEHVYSTSSFLTWLDQSGLDAIVGSVKGAQSNSVRVRVGIANELVGDIRLQQLRTGDYNERTEWLLHSTQGMMYLQNNPRDYLGASKAAVNFLLNPANNWVDDDTKQLRLTFCTYSNQAELFALTEVHVPLDRSGFVVPIVKSTALMVNAYPVLILYAVDILYLLVICYAMYCECKDMCLGIRLGFKEFLDYWSIWNVVDWCSTSLGFLNIILWVCACVSMQSKAIRNLLGDDMRLKPNVAELDLSDVSDLRDALNYIHMLFLALHITVAATSLFLVLKFFKGFRANPRLETVTMTLTSVFVDVFHFLVVSLTIFVSFAVIAHVLFGSDITKFFTLASSLNTGVTILMGEFDWYVALDGSPNLLPSGMPRVLLTLWFVIYMFFVLLVMLNMLLGIILESYSELHRATSMKLDSDSRTLWAQCGRFIQRKLQTRDFMPLNHIRQELENDADPAHPAKVVTHNTLVNAFPGMKPEQAEWIMAFLRQELIARVDDPTRDEAELREIRMERFVQSTAEELHIVSSSVLALSSQLGQLEAAVNGEVTKDSVKATEFSYSASSTTLAKDNIDVDVEVSHHEVGPTICCFNNQHGASPPRSEEEVHYDEKEEVVDLPTIRCNI